MKTTKKTTIAIAMLISVLNFSQSQAYITERGSSILKGSATIENAEQYHMVEGKGEPKCKFNNKENRVCKEFYKNGNLAREIRRTNNGRNNEYKTFFYNGELANKGNYTNGQKNGLFKQYYWRSSSTSALTLRKPFSESSYKDGYKCGTSREFSPDGKITWSQEYN